MSFLANRSVPKESRFKVDHSSAEVDNKRQDERSGTNIQTGLMSEEKTRRIIPVFFSTMRESRSYYVSTASSCGEIYIRKAQRLLLIFPTTFTQFF